MNNESRFIKILLIIGSCILVGILIIFALFMVENNKLQKQYLSAQEKNNQIKSRISNLKTNIKSNEIAPEDYKKQRKDSLKKIMNLADKVSKHQTSLANKAERFRKQNKNPYADYEPSASDSDIKFLKKVFESSDSFMFDLTSCVWYSPIEKINIVYKKDDDKYIIRWVIHSDNTVPLVVEATFDEEVNKFVDGTMIQMDDM